MGKVASMTKYDRNINPLRVLMIIVIISMLFCAKIVSSEELKVEMLDKSYAPEILYSEVGDKIIWPKSKGHNVEFVAGPNSVSLPKRSKMNKQYDIVLETPGMYYYWCTPHKGMGMIGLIVVGGDTSNKAAIAKAKAFGKSKKKLASMLEKL